MCISRSSQPLCNTHNTDTIKSVSWSVSWSPSPHLRLLNGNSHYFLFFLKGNIAIYICNSERWEAVNLSFNLVGCQEKTPEHHFLPKETCLFFPDSLGSFCSQWISNFFCFWEQPFFSPPTGRFLHFERMLYGHLGSWSRRLLTLTSELTRYAWNIIYLNFGYCQMSFPPPPRFSSQHLYSMELLLAPILASLFHPSTKRHSGTKQTRPFFIRKTMQNSGLPETWKQGANNGLFPPFIFGSLPCIQKLLGAFVEEAESVPQTAKTEPGSRHKEWCCHEINTNFNQNEFRNCQSPFP